MPLLYSGFPRNAPPNKNGGPFSFLPGLMIEYPVPRAISHLPASLVSPLPGQQQKQLLLTSVNEESRGEPLAHCIPMSWVCPQGIQSPLANGQAVYAWPNLDSGLRLWPLYSVSSLLGKDQDKAER